MSNFDFTLQLKQLSLTAQWIATCTGVVWRKQESADVMTANLQLCSVTADLVCRPSDDRLISLRP